MKLGKICSSYKFYCFKLFRHIDYVVCFLSLIILTVFILDFIFYKEAVRERDKAITYAISLVGLTITGFQFAIAQLNIRKKRFFDLRYAVYKELAETVQQFMDTINSSLSREVATKNPQELTTKLLIHINSFSTTAKLNEQYLFPGIFDSDASKSLFGTLKEIHTLTTKFRDKVKTLSNKSGESREETQGRSLLLWMDWQDKMIDLLKKLDKDRYEYYKELRRYF